MAKDFNEFSKWLYSHDGWRAWDKREEEVRKSRRNRGTYCNGLPEVSMDEHRLMFILSEYHKQLHSHDA